MSAEICIGRSARPQRAVGRAEIGVAAGAPRSQLSHLYQSDPCRVLFPSGEAGDPFHAVVLTTSGGLTGGDRVSIDIGLDAAAAACVATQAAEKIYRAATPADEVGIDVRLDVGTGACLEWLPQETIVFDGARLRRRTVAEVAAGGTLLACEMLVLGRAASGERLTSGRVLDSWRLYIAGRLVWADSLRLDGAPPPAPAGFGTANALATIVHASPGAAAAVEAARGLLPPPSAACRGAATVVNGVLLVRLLGEATVVRGATVAWLGGWRALALGLPNRLPRVWHV